MVKKKKKVPLGKVRKNRVEGNAKKKGEKKP